MPTAPGDETRSVLIAAAQRLMAEHGIDGVDLKDILGAAGQRNRSAITYHFGSREGLLRAIGAANRKTINEERMTILDRLEARGDLSIDSLVEATVQPLAHHLDDQPGRDYIVILAEAGARLGTEGLYKAERLHTQSLVRSIELLTPLLAGSAAAKRRRIGQAFVTVPVLLADLARDVNRDALTLTQARRRVPGVIDFVASALQGITRT